MSLTYSVEIGDDIVDLPGPLNESGEQFFIRVYTYTKENGLHNNIDDMLIWQAAIWWQQYLAAEQGIREYGSVIHYDTGHQQVSPNVSNMQKAAGALNIMFEKLGIGETARRKLKITGSAAEINDPLNNL